MLLENNPVRSAMRIKGYHIHREKNHVYLCRKDISGKGVIDPLYYFVAAAASL